MCPALQTEGMRPGGWCLGTPLRAGCAATRASLVAGAGCLALRPPDCRLSCNAPCTPDMSNGHFAFARPGGEQGRARAGWPGKRGQRGKGQRGESAPWAGKHDFFFSSRLPGSCAKLRLGTVQEGASASLVLGSAARAGSLCWLCAVFPGCHSLKSQQKCPVHLGVCPTGGCWQQN